MFRLIAFAFVKMSFLLQFAPYLVETALDEGRGVLK